MQNKPLKIYTDGACLKNPGGIGGYGATLLTDPVTNLSGHIPAPTTNNRAELMAVIVAMFHAQTLGYKNLLIYSDSRYVVDSLTYGYKRNVNQDLWDLSDLAISTLERVKFQWVKGHNGNEYNELADKLACDGMYKYAPEGSPQAVVGFNVTKIGELLKPKMTAVNVNKFLTKHGYQIKHGEEYIPVAPNGTKYSIVDNFVDFNGYGYSRLIWKPAIVTELQSLISIERELTNSKVQREPTVDCFNLIEKEVLNQ